MVLWANVQAPIVLSPCYLGLVVVMGYELSRDVLRASQLVHELEASEAGLRESEARMSLAVEPGDLGIWIRDLARNEIWASDKWRALFGFAPSERLEFDDILNGCTRTIANTSSRLTRWRSRARVVADTRANTG